MELRFLRGPKANLPASLAQNELAVTTDTLEVFVGAGPGKPIHQITDMGEMGKLMIGGITILYPRERQSLLREQGRKGQPVTFLSILRADTFKELKEKISLYFSRRK